MNHPKANSLINDLDSNLKYYILTFGADQRRAMAVNAIGQSDPLPLVKSLIARNERDLLEASGRPEAYDWNRILFDLNWNKPMSDGGCAIEG